jgi:hypothetical protein
MKTRQFTILIALCTILAVSCKKKSEDSSTPTPTTTGFTCKINGTDFTADSASWTANGTQTFIMAYKGGSAAFEINLAGVTATSYPVQMGTNDFIYWPTSANYSGGTDGSVTISTYDKTALQISGSFGTINTSGPGGTFTISAGNFTKIPGKLVTK